MSLFVRYTIDIYSHMIVIIQITVNYSQCRETILPSQATPFFAYHCLPLQNLTFDLLTYFAVAMYATYLSLALQEVFGFA